MSYTSEFDRQRKQLRVNIGYFMQWFEEMKENTIFPEKLLLKLTKLDMMLTTANSLFISLTVDEIDVIHQIEEENNQE